jgi:hypothetical protein
MTMDDPADSRTELQRAIAERARASAVGQYGHRPQRYWQYPIGLILAALVVGLVFFGFDTFLSSMQKLIEIMGDRPVPTAPVQTEPVPTEPMPVFMVPEPPKSP